jgi:hypothetical protein
MPTFSFTNPSGSAYFVYQTVGNSQNFYDSASLKAASGSFTSLNNVSLESIVQSDYVWAVVVPQGNSSLTFTPSVVVPGGSVNYLTTGMYTYTVT